MAKYRQGLFTPKNPEKYVGKSEPRFRSSWELAVFRMCDQHPGILKWGSETHRIPYKHPLTGKSTTYIPDLLIVYVDRNGNQHAEMVEIKPSSQTLGEAKSKQDMAAAVVNDAKWKAARAWCKSYGLGFRVITEKEIFNNAGRSSKRSNPKKGRR